MKGYKYTEEYNKMKNSAPKLVVNAVKSETVKAIPKGLWIRIEDTVDHKLSTLQKMRRSINSKVLGAYRLETGIYFNEGEWKIDRSKSFAVQMGLMFLDPHLSKEDQKKASKLCSSQEKSCYKRMATEVDEIEEFLNSPERKKTRRFSKPITSVSYLLKLMDKFNKPETPDNREDQQEEDQQSSEASDETVQKETVQVKIPQTEEDMVKFMVEKGFDLDKVLEIICDHLADEEDQQEVAF